MTTHFLIFPMVLNDQEFGTLDQISKDLSKLDFNKICSVRNCKQNIIYHLAKAIITIQDVTKSKNCQGYRYTSYALNMAVLKLEFVKELLIKEDCKLLKDEITAVKQSIIQISSILEGAYIEYKKEIYTVG